MGMEVSLPNSLAADGPRIPFAIQWVWPIPLILVCIFCPESPTWRESFRRP